LAAVLLRFGIAQAFAILPKIRAWDEFLANVMDARSRVYEVHPEVSFAALNNGFGLVEPKKAPEGAEARRALLGREFGVERVRALMAACPRNIASADDVLDGLVALWTAQRIFHGVAQTLPATPALDSAGLRTAIYF